MDKTPGFVEDLELADQAGGATSNLNVRGNMTRDERDMAFYGKKEQLKVREMPGPKVWNLMKSSGGSGFRLSSDLFAVFWQPGK